MRLPRLIPLAAVLAACAPGAEEAVFIERLGNDTMAVETYTRYADRIEGRIVSRQPQTRLATYTAQLDDAGRITSLTGTVVTPAANPDGSVPQNATATIVGDSVRVELSGAREEAFMLPLQGPTVLAVPRTPIPLAFMEQAIRQATAAGQDQWTFAFYGVGNRRVTPNTVTRRSPTEVALDFFGSPMTVHLDAEGNIQHLSGQGTTMQVEVERVAAGTVNFDSLADDFARRDAAGSGLGVASPRDTVELTAGGARLTVDYSRPAKRGRPIWGGLVPFDTIWRTGANAATHFVTTRNLQIGTARVPAGTYTLWTTFTANGGQLHINRQTGIWGTAYDSTQDLATTALSRNTLAAPVERFTIALESAARGAMLKLQWDTTEWTVPITVR